ncbi:MAG: bifunctional phosphoribosylaminoimidazolecarboxamide formyltransferase/IMP cyclohydrolase [Clostridia bacterium]|nr:bifunctional phosphoribosylaminoimidazolecarboxamide formyltransferase/IMP cyclohydrolase [Clostridia bacterium]
MRRAIISVSDKTGIVEFSKEIAALGFEILSTGGTAKTLTEAGIAVTNVSDVTGFPECLDGRVKTLHPMIHAGILAMRSNQEHMDTLKTLGVEPIDLVVINLYPFKATVKKPEVTLEDAIENIDIGGPTMLRAAAKNWQDVAVVVDPADYATVIDGFKKGEVAREDKFKLALKVFEHTAAYDSLISSWLRKQIGGGMPEKLSLTFEKVQSLRYGENPHQSAAFYAEPLNTEGTLAAAKQLHGKELSFNNINDTNGAIDLLKEFEGQPCVVAVKHANPCGVGTGNNIYEAYTKAHDADPVSIYGGIVAANCEIDAATASEIAKIFIEVVVAPSFSAEAVEILTKKPNIRLLELPGVGNKPAAGRVDIKKVGGGLLVQDYDYPDLNMDELKVVTDRAPTEAELKAMLFGWKVVKHVKSNAIVLCKEDRTTGVGPGQMNRVGAADIAIKGAGAEAAGSVLASDAFFPFDDSVEQAHAAGVTAIIQPGGSIRDQDSIDKCNKYGIAMVFTGMRHFKH